MSTEDTSLKDRIHNLGITIAIDGPAGSGKSTVSREVANRLGIGYLDTGAMYRALTWYALENNVDLSDEDAVISLAPAMPLRLESAPNDPHVWMGEEEITSAIREPRIALGIPQVSTNLQVRRWMAEEQRRRMMQARDAGSGMVAEGRDTTTVVCPDADVRVLLVADPEARLRRRTLELFGDDSPENMEKVRAQVENRDRADSTVSQFMEPAPGVTVVDSSHLTIPEVVDAIVELVRADLSQREKTHSA
ncbi:MAG: (d)CMP kinase [Actinomycetaceae bacterium]|nr:(d)CMP kinase [Actinomycetaceae bacterium]